jgi:hypothetical protein
LATPASAVAAKSVLAKRLRRMERSPERPAYLAGTTATHRARR